MKTAKEKAETWLNDNVEEWNVDHLNSLAILLEEQDMETRDVCARACLFDKTYAHGYHFHNICMNVDGAQHR